MKIMWVFVGVLTMACGVPIKVTRVNPTSEVKGVRYTVLRPSYHAALFWTDDQEWQFQLEQKVDQPVVFEAESRVNPLATTDLSFTLEDDGRLSAIMGGQTDKTLETIQAAAGLAKTFAAAAPGPKGVPSPCQNFVDLDGYQAAHKAMQARVRLLAHAIDSEEGLDPSRDRLEHLQALRDELKAAKEARDAHTLSIPTATLGIRIDTGDYISGSPTSCVQVTLQKVQSL